MKRFFTVIGLTLYASATAFAATDIDLTKTNLPYSDVDQDSIYALPISMLTSEGVLEGNPDGTFRPRRTLNRAEFLKIVISMRHPVFEPPSQPCFPDVDPTSWYADEVCFAKSWNIVSGYPDGNFRPESPVNYVEALKILAEIFGYNIAPRRGDEWFTPYLRTAKMQGTALDPTTSLSSPIARGQMASLAARFLAEARFELDRYKAVERGEIVVVAEEDDKSPEETKTGTSSVSSESEIESDPLPNQLHIPPIILPNLKAISSFLVLGEKNNVIATIEVTPLDEPVEIRTVTITLENAVSSISSFEIFDDLGYALGTAAIDLALSSAGDVFTLNLSPTNAYYIAKDDQIVLAARPRTKDIDTGGVSGQIVQVQSIDIIAIGRWSSNPSSITTSGPDFQKHQTSIATIESIKPSGETTGVFTTGIDKKIGAFTFTARSNSDVESDPAIESFSISANFSQKVSLSNILLRGNDVDTEHSCSIAGNTITCTSIPASIGSLQSPRTISVFADISLTGDESYSFLSIELSRSGRPDNAGNITWSDGVTSFTWIPFDQPIARGTSWE